MSRSASSTLDSPTTAGEFALAWPEDGADPKLAQDQVGHQFASTTAVYTNVSGCFMNTMMRKVLDSNLALDKGGNPRPAPPLTTAGI